MHEKLLYITMKNETMEEALLKIQMTVGHAKLDVWSSPISLAGNAKILELHESTQKRLVKIDGPGFLITDLYKHFLGNRSLFNKIGEKIEFDLIQ